MKVYEEKVASKTISIIIITLIVLMSVIILLFTNGRETHIWDDYEPKKISALVCTAGSIDGAFFSSDSANTVKNEIKITFSNNRTDKMFYSFEGVYRSEELAKYDDGILHAKYNIYMGGHGEEHGNLAPTYSVMDTKYQITLYADKMDRINNVTATFFFIDSDEIDNFKKGSIENVSSYYEKQGFSCRSIN